MISNNFVVVYDACVLYPAHLRDFLLHLALSSLFKAKWSDDIHEEWINSLSAARPDLKKSRLDRTKVLMDKAVPDALISRSRYEELLPSLQLPDQNDCHVLAAAIVCQAQLIVTFNLKDFPKSILGKYEIEAIHPDNFIFYLLDISSDEVINSIYLQQSILKNPPLTIQDILAILRKNGLPKSISKIESILNLTS